VSQKDKKKNYEYHLVVLAEPVLIRSDPDLEKPDPDATLSKKHPLQI
jgi:hypothetical protein